MIRGMKVIQPVRRFVNFIFRFRWVVVGWRTMGSQQLVLCLEEALTSDGMTRHKMSHQSLPKGRKSTFLMQTYNYEAFRLNLDPFGVEWVRCIYGWNTLKVDMYVKTAGCVVKVIVIERTMEVHYRFSGGLRSRVSRTILRSTLGLR